MSLSRAPAGAAFTVTAPPQNVLVVVTRRIGDVLLDRIGNRRERVALAIGIERRCIRAANHLSDLFQSPRRSAAPLDSTNAARSQ